jgi:hypothetical protein
VENDVPSFLGVEVPKCSHQAGSSCVVSSIEVGIAASLGAEVEREPAERKGFARELEDREFLED